MPLTREEALRALDRIQERRQVSRHRLTTDQREAIVKEFANSDPPPSYRALARKYGVVVNSVKYLIVSRALKAARGEEGE